MLQSCALLKYIFNYYRFIMKRFFLLIIFCSLLSIISHATDKVTLKTLVIDAGHGGKDPGACGKIIMEKEVALKIALKLGEQISKSYPDLKIIYTRSTDVFIPLDERAKIANKIKADLFISIHANMISNPNTKGTETFVLGLHRTEDNLEVAKKENSVIVMEEDYTTKYEGFDPNLSESYIIFELIQNIYLDQSIEIASSVQKEMNGQSKRNDRGVKQAGFLVLRQTSMPSLLIETGFLSNKDEEKFLASESGQYEIANSISNAFSAYKIKFEAKSAIQNQEKIVIPTAITDDKNYPIYKIQVTSSAKKLKSSDFPLSKLKNTSYFEEGNKYKYTVGNTSDINEIKNLLLKTKKIVKDAFIVGFDKDAVKLSNAKIKKLLDAK